MFSRSLAVYHLILVFKQQQKNPTVMDMVINLLNYYIFLLLMYHLWFLCLYLSSNSCVLHLEKCFFVVFRMFVFNIK